MRTALFDLNPWNELPVWAALMIKTTAPGLALPERWEGWEYEYTFQTEPERITVYASGYRYNVVRGHSHVF